MSKGVNQTLYRNELAFIKSQQKIIPFPTLAGKFFYDEKTGFAMPDEQQKLIWGFTNSKCSIMEVISKIESYSVSAFIESVTKKELFTETPTITLANGNQVKEEYIKTFHPEDYEFLSLVSITGVTRLVA